MPDAEGERWSKADSSATAIFLWQGFMDVACPGNDYRTLTPEQAVLYDSHFDGVGQDGGAMSIGYIAAVLDEEYKKLPAGEGFDGVYHYEITEPMGSWLAKEGPRLHDFQYSDSRVTAIDAVKKKYHEMMTVWSVTEKLTA